MLIVIKKCKFFIRKTTFIRFIIKLGYINIDLKKAKAIVNQQELENIIQLKNIKLFIRLIKKEELQVKGSKQRELFKKLKELFTV